MPRTRACDYCGDDIEPGTGTMFVRTNGSTIHYCSAKCEKNADLGREARDLEWTAAGQAEGAEAVEAIEETEAETVEEVDEREEAGTAPDLEEAEAEGVEESEAEADAEAETDDADEDAEDEETEEAEA
jgi:large subunit ribosomal protein L24e